jgi:hypothetical protein
MPHLFSIFKAEAVLGYEWISLDALKNLAFSSGHRRIFAEVQQQLALLHKSPQRGGKEERLSSLAIKITR